MSNNEAAIIIPEEYKDKLPFQFPFYADADMVRDSNDRVVAHISRSAAPEEAVRLAKLFASAAESLNRLNNVSKIIEATTKDLPDYNHGTLNEHIDDCLICYIDHYVKKVLS